METPPTNRPTKAHARPQQTATFKDYRRVFGYASKWDLVAYAAGLLASVGAGVTLPLMNVVFGTRKRGVLLDRRACGERFRLCAADGGRWGWVPAATEPAILCFRMIGIRLSSAIRLHYLRRLFAQSIHVLDSMPPGEATTTMTTTSNTLQLGISEKLGVLVEFASTMVAAVVIAFTYDWALALVTSSALVFILLTVALLLPCIVKSHDRMAKSEAKSSAVASESLAGIRMVMACGAETRVARKYSRFVDEAKRHARFTSPFVALQFGLIFFAAFAAFSLAFWYGAKSYLQGRLNSVATIIMYVSIPQAPRRRPLKRIVSVLLSVMMVLFSLERVSTPLMAIGKATVAASQLFIVIDAPQPEEGHLRAPDVSATDDIVLRGVTFAYPSRPHVKVLDQLSLHIEAGKITAIVGPSGSGKSTVVGLIERWYSLREQHVMAEAVEKEKKKKREKKKRETTTATTTTKKDKGADDESDAGHGPGDAEIDETGPPVRLGGTISVSGQPLEAINVKWWRSQIGLVQQEPFLFNDTIYINVANGLVGSEWESEPEATKRELVKQACRESFADEFIDKLPERYDTIVGDGGAKLSGGQRQRIAIARSIVRKPKILILDEATSSIDVRGEAIVQAALDRVAKGRTTITIAHRLSTVNKADRIVVLKRGKMMESGTHQTLMSRDGGVYAGLVNAQALSLGASTEDTSDHGHGKFGDDDQDESRPRHGTTGNVASLASLESGSIRDSPERQRNLFASFGLLLYESKKHWWLLALTMLFAAGAGAAIPLQAWLFGNVVTLFAGPRLATDSSFWSLMWLVLAIGAGLAYCGCFLSSTQMEATIRAKYQKEYFESILHQETAFFDDERHSQGTMTARASGDPKKLEELMGSNMASVYIALFNLCGSIAIAFAFAWKLALVGCCIVMPVSLAATYWRFKYEIQFDNMNNAVFAESSKFASESIGAFRTVASLTLEGPICDRFEDLCRGHVAAAFRKARWASALFALSDSASLACQALVFYYGGRLLVGGEIGPLNFLVCLMAAIQSGESAGQGLSFGPNMAQVTAASNRILHLRESRLHEKTWTEEAMPGAQGGVSIELEDVHFSYPTRSLPVFQGLSLFIEKGQFAALVGASGCGKTSIISLLERFYHLDKGRILCNGQDISKLDLYAYRRHLSLVAQEATLFQGTIRDNIMMGVDESTVSEAQLHQACRDASIHDFIVSLPEGYDTNVGSRGVALSGGQKQRVAIARALMRDPDVLLLDEATSSLDSESERLVQEAFERAGRGRTMLVVAHRLATVQKADVIFVLGEGKLLEKGNHAELLRQKGTYWQMCQSQALDR
ncbi:multidrug resistance-type transporter protein [Ophiocordyceps camponoti-floridani]|uniref:Multidrug resistance-type transporter protein n=1 Tax=Ophiocordyceps camponoti-floridani TaxID=2030778 RepID=A0A8H4QC82_9HYPO|nr:multidrug resistance-type transporter protein [Ophiocordyceps camponoti-floridani]